MPKTTDSTPTTTTITTSMAQFRSPPNFSFEPKEWPIWKDRWEHYYTLSEMNQKPSEYQVHALIYTMGKKVDELVRLFGLSATEKKTTTVLEAFETRFMGTRNVIYERATFGLRNKHGGESIEEFITALHTLSEHCNYGTVREELVRDRLVIGVRDKQLREKLMLIENLTLSKAIEIAKSWEAVKQQNRELQGESSTKNVDRMQKKIPGRNKERKHKLEENHVADVDQRKNIKVNALH